MINHRVDTLFSRHQKGATHKCHCQLSHLPTKSKPVHAMDMNRYLEMDKVIYHSVCSEQTRC
ncbi:unnamed protein product [Boreogadus saida]